MKQIFLITVFLISCSFSENLVSPRELALAGSITSSAMGFESANVNPARFAFSKPSYNLFQLSNSINNNLISLDIYNRLNGSVMYEEDSDITQSEFIDYIGTRDLKIATNVNLNIPFVNFNNQRYAVHWNLSEFIDAKMGNELLLLAFEGNEWEKEISFDLEFMSVFIGEYGISWWTKNSSIAVGGTIKYLQGISYLHLYTEEQSEPLFTDSSGVNLSAVYRLDQYPGGSGFATDFGLAMEDENTGWSIGISAINLFGFLKWDTHNSANSLLGKSISNMLPLDGYQAKITKLNILNLTADNFLSGESGIPDSVISQDTTLISLEQSPIKMDYPSMFRLGATKKMGSDFSISYDVRTGFRDGETITKNWITSVGIEITRFPIFPLRLGISNGAALDKRLGLGFGIRINPIQFDVGLAWNGSRKLYTATGFELGASLNLIR